MAASYSKHGFNNLTYARLSEYTSSSSVVLRLIHGYVSKFLQGWAPGLNMFVTLRDVEGNIEICKITDIQGDNLTVTRGQDGTIARDWPVGTLVTQRAVSESLGRVIQKGEFRTVTYNPNGVLIPDYPNEKVYQSGDACHRRWWIHAVDNKWRLNVGDICDDEYWDDGWIWKTIMPQLFCFGSINSDDTDQFDADTNAWASKTAIYENKMGAAAASPSGSDGINLFGGGTGQDDSNQDNLRWGTGLSYTVKTDMPSPPRSAHMAVGNYDNYGYCFGGSNFLGAWPGTVLSDNDRYSQSGDSWLNRTAVPSPARMAGAAGRPYLGEIYYTGGDTAGYAQGNPTGDHDEYSESGDSWTGKTDLFRVRSECSGACDLDYFYIAYGRNDLSISNQFDYFYPGGNSWVALTDAYGGPHYEVHGSGNDVIGATYHIGGDLDGFEKTVRRYFFGWSLGTNALTVKGYHTVAQSTDFDGLTGPGWGGP